MRWHSPRVPWVMLVFPCPSPLHAAVAAVGGVFLLFVFPRSSLCRGLNSHGRVAVLVHVVMLMICSGVCHICDVFFLLPGVACVVSRPTDCLSHPLV